MDFRVQYQDFLLIPGGGVSIANKNGKLLFLINDVGSICAGTIGTSGKICCRLEKQCSVAKHKLHKHDKVEPGYYLKISEVELSTLSFVPKELVNPTLESVLLNTEFKPKQLNALIQVLNQQEKPGDMDLDRLKVALSGLTEGQILQTPAVKRRKVLPLENKYQNMLQSWNESTGNVMKSEVEESAMANLKEFCDFTVDSLIKDEEAISGLGQQLEFVRTIIGTEQDETNYTNIWNGILDLKGKIEAFESKLLSIDKTKMLDKIKNATIPIRTDLVALNSNAQSAFSAVEAKLIQLEQSIAKTPHSGSSFLNNLSNSSFEQSVKEELNNLHTQVVNLQSSVIRNIPQGREAKEIVTVGQYSFGSIQELAVWAKKHLPATLPFGGFVDIYSYLERVNSFKDVASTTVLKNMEVRQKLDLTADEALIIESFKHPLPRIFNGGSSANAATYSAWLPGVPSKDKWEDNVGLSGAKITIRDNEATIRTRIEEVISQRLNGHMEAQSIARILLSDTITFAGALNCFISETYK